MDGRRGRDIGEAGGAADGALFSDLNNLTDITLDPAYSSICGYTESDLETVFAPEMAGLDRERVREWYNGYSWLGAPPTAAPDACCWPPAHSDAGSPSAWSGVRRVSISPGRQQLHEVLLVPARQRRSYQVLRHALHLCQPHRQDSRHGNATGLEHL